MNLKKVGTRAYLYCRMPSITEVTTSHHKGLYHDFDKNMIAGFHNSQLISIYAQILGNLLPVLTIEDGNFLAVTPPLNQIKVLAEVKWLFLTTKRKGRTKRSVD